MPLKSPAITAEIAKLSRLAVTDLRTEWSRLIGGVPPKNARREYLLRAVAHQLQCKAHGELSPKILRGLLKLADDQPTDAFPPSVPTRTLKSGARILREWKGVVHEIEVVETGYRYGAHTYKSLSIIARQITGTRWSGPAFFGLKQPETTHAR